MCQIHYIPNVQLFDLHSVGHVEGNESSCFAENVRSWKSNNIRSLIMMGSKIT